MKQKHYYTYKIILTAKDSELYNHWYRGARITTKNPEDDYYKGSSSVLKKLKYWDKYPLDYIKTDIVEYDTPEEMYEAEYNLIGDSYKTDPLCLNRFIGGIGGHSKWDNLSDEEKFEIHHKSGGKNKGKKHIIKHPEITHERLSKINLGRIFTEEWRNNISKSKIGVKRIKENYKDYEGYINKLKTSLTGRTLSDEQKLNQSKKMKQYYSDDNNRKKVSESTKKAMEAPEIRDKCRIGGYNTQGRIFINKDKTNKRVKPEELDKYIAQGWVKGRYKSW